MYKSINNLYRHIAYSHGIVTVQIIWIGKEIDRTKEIVLICVKGG